MEQQRAAILALSARGKMPTQIAADLGCSRQTVYRTVQRGTPKAPPRIKAKPARPPEVIEAVREAVASKKQKATIRGLAREFDMDRSTMRRLIHDNLGLKSYKRTPRQALKPADKKQRVARAKVLLSKLKHKPPGVVILHEDETPFSLGEIVSGETGYYLAEAVGEAPDESVHYGKERHYATIQILSVVASDGQKCPLVFLDTGDRLNQFSYMDYLKETVFPWARRTYGDGWWLQHNGASCHTANATQDLLRQETPGFFDKKSWPAHSPDLAPMDYAIFGRLKAMISGVQYKTKDQLKAAINDA